MDGTTDTSFPVRSLNTFDNTQYQAERRLARKKQMDQMQQAFQRAGSIPDVGNPYASDLQSLTSTQTAPAAFSSGSSRGGVQRARDLVTDLYGGGETFSSSHHRRHLNNLAPRRSSSLHGDELDRQGFLEDVELQGGDSVGKIPSQKRKCISCWTCVSCWMESSVGCWSARTKFQRWMLLLVFLVILPLFIVVLAVTISNKNDSGGSNKNTSGGNSVLSIVPPIAVLPLDEERHVQIRNTIINSGVTLQENLDETGTPSNLALRWLTDYDEARLEPSHQALLQRYALAVLFFSTHEIVVTVNSGTSLVLGEHEWFSHDNWMSHQGICIWHGVSCPPIIINGKQQEQYNDNTAIIKLDLMQNNMEGFIPHEMYAMENLQWLDLGKNELFGSIPTAIGHLRGLTNLFLMDNQLTGFLPTELGLLKEIQNLDLGKNVLEGTVPTQLQNLKQLETLGLNQNYLSGTIPNVASFEKLRVLYLDDNAFSGLVPYSWERLSLLQDLRLSKNYLLGSIPSGLFELPRLELLYLGNNDLTGIVPDLMDFMPRLQEVHLYKNQLTGPLPQSAGSLSLLRILYLDNNQFTGPIPDTYGDLDDVTDLYVYNNHLSGNLPSTLQTMKNLKDFRANSNFINGTLVEDIGLLLNLEHLHLHDNEFTGTVPVQVGELDRLKTLRLYRNNLVGTVPEEVCKLKEKHALEFLASDCDEVQGKIECECCNECYP